VLRTRVITSFIVIPLILGSVYVGELVFFMAVMLALLIGGWEFFQMVRNVGHRPTAPVGLGLIAALTANAYLRWGWEHEILVGAVVLSLVLALFWHEEGWLASWALTIGGALYVGGLGSYFILVRELNGGLVWTILAIVTVWATDGGAYIVGTTMGRRAFFPSISPKKTWEGAIGGWVAATLATSAFAWVFGLPLLPFGALGFGLGLAATFGDLAESLLKRQSGVKDSGTIMPGHGGILDRMDSLLFAAVFIYYYVILVLLR